MAIADISDYGINQSVELLASATATNSAPSGATAGLEVAELDLFGKGVPETVTLLFYSTAGSGTMTVTGRIWGYHPKPAK